MIRFYDTPEDFANATQLCNAWVATAIVGSAVVGGAIKAYSASEAMDKQIAAGERAAATRQQGADRANSVLSQYGADARAQLDPYANIGKSGIDMLNANKNLMLPVDIPQEMLDLQKPLTIDQATLETLPGYEFARKQGLKAVQNSAAARGLGTSGAALKGAATFSQGLADQNFNNYFNTEMQNRQAAFGRYDTTLGRRIQQNTSAFDRIKSLIDLGGNAASRQASITADTGKGISGNITGAAGGQASDYTNIGNAQAAGTNAIGGALAGAVDNIGGYYAYQGLYGGKPSNQSGMEFVKGAAGDQYVPTYR